jgi:putative hemolysin
MTDETTEIPDKLIDIEGLFAAKNPKILKFIPRFVLSYLKRITHQDEINGYIWRNRHLSGLPFLDAILKEFGVNVEVRNFNRVAALLSEPANRPTSHSGYIIAANHPLGGLDGMALMQAVGRIRPDIVFPVNDLLMNVPGLRPLFIPINKHGRNTENARIIDETFASGKTILYFPAGLVSRKIRVPAHERTLIQTPDGQTVKSPKFVIKDLEWKTTFIKKAKKYHRDIIPVYIAGRNSEWFYNLARWRKRLGIKANLEMLYLVDEMALQLGKTITITFGEPIPWTTFDKSMTETQWAAMIRDTVYSMQTPVSR